MEEQSQNDKEGRRLYEGSLIYNEPTPTITQRFISLARLLNESKRNEEEKDKRITRK